MGGAEGASVVHEWRCHLDSWCRDCLVGSYDKWDKGDSLRYDDKSIRRFDGCFRQTQLNLAISSNVAMITVSTYKREDLEPRKQRRTMGD